MTTSYSLTRSLLVFGKSFRFFDPVRAHLYTSRNIHHSIRTLAPCGPYVMRFVNYSCQPNEPGNNLSIRKFGSQNAKEKSAKLSAVEPDIDKELTLFQKFKNMYTKYWYVLIPVHMATSSFWFGIFYTCAKSGIDIVPILEYCGISDAVLEPLKKTGAGYIAVTLAMYKLATPLRYTVTLGGTTLAIRFLASHGYIKPVPSKEKIKQIYDKKKEELQDMKNDFKDKLREDYKEYKKKKGS